MTRWLTRTLAPALALTLAFAPAAHAKKKDDKPEEGIWEVGIQTFDRVFSDVAAIDRKLTNAQTMLSDAKTQLNTALGIKNNTPIRKGLAELQERAGGKVSLAMTGKIPTLKANEAVPSDVQKGIDAVNGLSSNLVGSIEALASTPADVKALIAKSKTFPADLQKELKEGSIVDKIVAGPKAVKAVSHNMKVTKDLAPKSERVVSRMNAIQSTLTTEFVPKKSPAAAPKKR